MNAFRGHNVVECDEVVIKSGGITSVRCDQRQGMNEDALIRRGVSVSGIREMSQAIELCRYLSVNRKYVVLITAEWNDGFHEQKKN